MSLLNSRHAADAARERCRALVAETAELLAAMDTPGIVGTAGEAWHDAHRGTGHEILRNSLAALVASAHAAARQLEDPTGDVPEPDPDSLAAAHRLIDELLGDPPQPLTGAEREPHRRGLAYRPAVVRATVERMEAYGRFLDATVADLDRDLAATPELDRHQPVWRAAAGRLAGYLDDRRTKLVKAANNMARTDEKVLDVWRNLLSAPDEPR